MGFKINSISLKMLACIGMLTFLVSCGEEKLPQPNTANCDIDQLAVQNAYRVYAQERFAFSLTKVTTLKQSITALTNQANATSLQNAQDAFFNAYMAYTQLPQLDLGVGFTVKPTPFFDEWLNAFPCDDVALSNRISNGNTDISSANSYELGYPALEFLLFGTDSTNDGIANRITENTSYQNLLTAEIDFLVSAITQLRAFWNGSESEFITTTPGTGGGSPLSLLVNAIIKNFDNSNNKKLKEPAGRYNPGNVYPQNAEGRFMDKSIALANESYLWNKTALSNIGDNGLSILDYVKCIEGNSESQVNQDISNQFLAIENAWLPMKDPIANHLNNDAGFEELNTIINELQKLTPPLKSRMVSILNVQISYVDADGD